HCQGIALDRENRWLYFSFTTALVKTDLSGRLLGTVTGLTGHLGCIAFREADGRVYGSLEYKNDAVGRGIYRHLGLTGEIPAAFYAAVFDGRKIDRIGMDAERDGVMRAAFLSEVTRDFLAEGEGGKPHRFACSGIDGISFGPAFGRRDGEEYLKVAYGVYRDEERSDNDHQVILSYDPEEILASAKPLRREAMHSSGPRKPAGKFFLYTGNTEWGVQNLEYDRFTGNWLLAVYPGFKKEFPNCPLYIADGSLPPKEGILRGIGETGSLLTLKRGPVPGPDGVSGFPFPYGSTGLYSFGDGRYYISHEGRSEKGEYTEVFLYRYDEKASSPPFERIG
ncbi:MAG: hypothetical protein J5849_04000, partial [Clostridia bacterium]|nr:hypothetical protein [Clostridia bacterium]